MVNLEKPPLNPYAGDAECNAWYGNGIVGYTYYRECVAVKKRYMKIMKDKKYDTVL